MAAAILLDGPAGQGFTGHLDLGQFSANTQMGRARFQGTVTTATIPIISGGLMGTPLVFTNYPIVDKTLVPTISGSTLTLTRTDNDSSTIFSYLILYFT